MDTAEIKLVVGFALFGAGDFLVPVIGGWAYGIAVLGLAVAIWGVRQNRQEMKVLKRADWKREVQQFRRHMGSAWQVLRRLWGKYREQHASLPTDFQAVVEGSDWPYDPWGADSPLPAFLDWVTSHGTNGVWDNLVDAKSFVEIWGDILDEGGGLASPLREILREISERHSPSLKLLWFGALAHYRSNPVPGAPDRTPYELVRKAMHPNVTFPLPHQPPKQVEDG